MLGSLFQDLSGQGELICDSDINFDRALPGLHRYLGADSVDVGVRTHIEPGTETQMYGFYRSGIVLVPGYTIPLLSTCNEESTLLQSINNEKKSVIFLPGYINHSDIKDFVGCIGTTADLITIWVPDPEDTAPLRAIFVGRQRIRITRTMRDANCPIVCQGVVLPEASMDRNMASNLLGCGLVPRSWSRFASDPSPSFLSHLSRTTLQVPAHSRRTSSRHSSSKSSLSDSSSQSHYTNSCFLTTGNPYALFDSRLSTWRRTKLISSGTSSSSCSPGKPFDHFVGDSNDELPLKELDSTYSSTVCDVENASEELEPRISHSSCTEDVELIMDRAVDRVGRPFRYRIKQPCGPRLLARRDVLAATALAFTAFPAWTCRQYDLNYLVSAIQAELVNWNDTWKVDKWDPELAIPFSYWLVQNLPMPGVFKSYILGIDHVIQRLRALLSIIRQSNAWVCVYCDANITSNRFVICLAQEGSSKTYVNPSGFLHDMVTLSQIVADSVTLVGDPSAEYSWFPGYSWTIINCTRCSSHLGWLFSTSNKDLRPRQFWGIRREAIVPGLINQPEWRPCI